MNDDARATVASMVRASRAIAEAAEVLATESKRIVALSGQARDLELAAERRLAPPIRTAVSQPVAPGVPAWARKPRTVMTIGASLIVVLMIAAVAVGALRTGTSSVPELLRPSDASLRGPQHDPLPTARPSRPGPPEAAPALPMREAIPSQYLPQAATR